MKKVLLLCSVLFFSCDRLQRDKAVETTKIKFDTISYTFDTIYNNVEISGSKFKLKSLEISLMITLINMKTSKMRLQH